MSGQTQAQRLIDSFAAIAGSLVDGDDTIEILQRLVESSQLLEGVDQAAILLIDEFEALDVVASTSEESRLMELLQIGAEAGPCIECVRTGRAVAIADIEDDPRWPDFRRGAREFGFRAVTCLPLRVRDTVIGSLNLLCSTAGSLADDDLRSAQALADIATVSVLHERALNQTLIVTEQLQRALSSRIVIEQAKGVLAHMHELDMEAAFALLRGYARPHSEPLADVARRVVALELVIEPD